MHRTLQLFYIFLILKCGTTLSKHPKVLIISYDGFRYNYIERGFTPTLAKLKKEGCHADHLESVFPSKTFPNHMSIATGVYTDVHGVMGSSFYDPVLKKEIEYSYDMWHFSDTLRPIWIENQVQGDGRHSGVMMWPGGDFNYTGVWPTYRQPWKEAVSMRERVDRALSWFQSADRPANLVMLYIEEPDGHSHAFGPDSPEHEQTLRTMDQNTKYILTKLKDTGLLNEVNVFFVSDHGMESVSANDIVDLRKYVDGTLFDLYGVSPALHIHPKPGKAKEVYDKLKTASTETGKFTAYRANEIPVDWHFKNVRTPPILIVAKAPYAFNDLYESIAFMERKYNFTAGNSSRFGVHGYDNKSPNMWPYFIASGPDIKPATRVPPFRTIDLFTVWAHLLGFPNAAKKTNGSPVPAAAILMTRPHVLPSSIIGAVLGILIVFSAMGVTIYFLHRKLRHKYEALLQTDEPELGGSRQRLLDSDDEDCA